MRCLYGLVGMALCAGSCFGALESASGLLRELRDSALDPAACFRVRDLQIAREDIKIYLTDGYLLFSKPVAGRRLYAVFSGETDTGDAEILLLPPHRSERESLAGFTHSPNMSEHLKSALFVFSDGTAEELIARLDGASAAKTPEMGALLESRWSSVLRNVQPGFEVRLADDLLRDAGASNGLFFMTAVGNKLGPFDVILDPTAREQIVVGQLTERNGRPAYDIWTAFASRSVRAGRTKPVEPAFTIDHFKINAAMSPSLQISATTTAHVKVGAQSTRSLPMFLSRRMRVTAVKIDGQPAELVARESLRAVALRGSDDEGFLVVSPQELAAGSEHDVEIAHEGAVIASAGNNVFYVGARATWYPRRGLEYATYDIRFSYPRGLSLVLPGAIVEDRIDGDVHIVERKVSTPIRLAGFNLGDYNQASATRGSLTVDVFSNRQVEAALQPKAREYPILPPFQPGGRRVSTPDMIPVSAPPDPKARLRALATDIASAFEFMSTQFGPPPLDRLTVSPIPGAFGQGFPGLLYLSTVAYLAPSDRPAAMRGKHQQAFFSDLLEAHETAHQWFGNLVSSAGYQDDWLMESLANYAALLYIEKKKGAKSVEATLEEFRSNLLATKLEGGKTMESAGPITFGARLESAAPDAWRTITYEKGTWILHMLRRRLGDDQFAKLLAELCRRYRLRSISTDEFRSLAAEFLPRPAGPRDKVVDPKLENFFENWVYGTGIPSVQVKHSVKGKAGAMHLSITLTQTGVDDDFTADVPVEIYYTSSPRGAKPAQVVWLRAGSDPTTHVIPVRQAPARVVVATGSILVRK
ncbi:MAG: M1 family aminopeptidase [Bryobacteraceae bacterium]